MRTKKTLISVGAQADFSLSWSPEDILGLWLPSKSSLGTFWIAKDVRFRYADKEDYDQTAWMRRLI